MHVLKFIGLGMFLIMMSSFPATADEYEDTFLDELDALDGEWFVVSQHFKHNENCTSRGCILMGPTTDREACDYWAKSYNKFDAFDHARCVDATGFTDDRY